MFNIGLFSSKPVAPVVNHVNITNKLLPLTTSGTIRRYRYNPLTNGELVPSTVGEWWDQGATAMIGDQYQFMCESIAGNAPNGSLNTWITASSNSAARWEWSEDGSIPPGGRAKITARRVSDSAIVGTCFIYTPGFEP